MVCGRTVAEAFDDLYYLERAAMVQVLAASTGAPLLLMDDRTVKLTKKGMDAIKPEFARAHLDAWKRELGRTEGPNRGAQLSLLAAGALAATSLLALRSWVGRS